MYPVQHNHILNTVTLFNGTYESECVSSPPAPSGLDPVCSLIGLGSKVDCTLGINFGRMISLGASYHAVGRFLVGVLSARKQSNYSTDTTLINVVVETFQKPFQDNEVFK